MAACKRRRQVKKKGKKLRQHKGGLFPLLALLPAAIAAGKAAALGAEWRSGVWCEKSH